MKKIILFILIITLAVSGCIPIAQGSPEKIESVQDMSPSYDTGFWQYIYTTPSTLPSWVKGMKLHYAWSDLEPTSGVTSFPRLATDVAATKAAGKSVGIDISSYEGDNWGGNGPLCSTVAAGTNCWSTTYPRQDGLMLPSDLLTSSYYYVCPTDGSYANIRIPKYNSTEYRNKISSFAWDLADYIKNTGTLVNDIEWIQPPLGIYGETTASSARWWSCLSGSSPNHNFQWYDFSNAQNFVFQEFKDAFDGTGIAIVGKITPYYSYLDTRPTITNYIASRGGGLENAAFNQDTDDQIIALGRPSDGMGFLDAIVRWKNQVPYHVETDRIAPTTDGALAGTKERNEAEEDYWNMASTLSNGIDVYMARYNNILGLKRVTWENPYVMSMINELNLLAGKITSTATTSKVWMRETQYIWAPQTGNFEYYMSASQANPPTGVLAPTQPSSKTTLDGNAVAVWNLADTYAAGTCTSQRGFYDADCDPRYRYARRTNSPSDPYIYINIDDQYFYGANATGNIIIVYLDAGTDQIKLQYKKGVTTYTESITKTNSKKWEHWVIPISSGIDLNNSFTSGSSTWDFRIWDNGDGNDIIHSVQMSPSGASSPPNTETPTPTPTSMSLSPVTIKFDGSNVAIEDTYINERQSTTTHKWDSEINLVADTFYQSPSPYESTKSSVLIDVPFSVNGTIISAALCFYVTQKTGTTNQWVYYREILSDWDDDYATWTNRLSSTAWNVAGAYGTDVGPENIGSLWSLAANNWKCHDVTQYADASTGLNVKLQPQCPIGTTSCNSTYKVASINYSDVSLRPYVIVEYQPIAPTQTPTPTPTRTPTDTPTATQTPTITPGGPTNTPTRTPTATPIGYQPPTPTATPTGISSNGDVKINEICINPSIDQLPGGGVNVGDRAVELWNSKNASINVSPYYLCSITNCVKLRGNISSGKYRVIYQGTEKLILSPMSVNLSLRDYGVTPYRIVDSVVLGNLPLGKCWARVYDGSSSWVLTNWPTLGWGNSIYSRTPTPTPRVQ